MFGIIKMMNEKAKKMIARGNFLISIVLAQGGSGDPGGSSDVAPGIHNFLEFGSISDVLNRIADILFTISIPLLVIMIILGAFYLLTAGGNEQRVTTGKNIIKWAIIGFVVILIAGSLTSLIQNLLG